MKDPKVSAEGEGDDQVSVEILFSDPDLVYTIRYDGGPDLVYTIRYDGGFPAQAAFDESAEKGIEEFLKFSGLSRDDFLNHPEANLDGKTVAEWAASTKVPRVVLTTKPKNGLLAKLILKTKEVEVARSVLAADRKKQEAYANAAKEKAVAMAKTVMNSPKQPDDQQRKLWLREKEQLTEQLEAEVKKKEEALADLKKNQELENEWKEEEERKRKEEEAAKVSKKKLELLGNHNDSLQKQLWRSQESEKTYKKLLHEVDKQRELVQEQLAKQGEAFEEERAGYEAKQHRLQEKQSSQQEIARKKSLKQQLLDQMGSFNSRLDSVEKENGELKEQVRELRKENGELKEQVRELRQENGELRVKNVELNDKVGELEITVDVLCNKVAKLVV